MQCIAVVLPIIIISTFLAPLALVLSRYKQNAAALTQNTMDFGSESSQCAKIDNNQKQKIVVFSALLRSIVTAGISYGAVEREW